MTMPRRPRCEAPGAIHHVIARGVNRCNVFVDDEDYGEYCRLLGRTVELTGWNVFCYCLMPNHVHLLVETPKPNLGAGVQWLHGRYGEYFNRRHERVGHLFQDRYRCWPVADEGRLAYTVGYIVFNPVAAVLCRDPDDWRWGSHAARRSDRSPWLAHDKLADRLDSVVPDAYEEIVDARRRGSAAASRR